jgi:AmiR/NasT family two-component response regulator
VMPRLRAALANRVVVEQAKGFLRASLDVSVADAFGLLRTYAHTSGQHLTDLAQRLMSDREARPKLIAALAELANDPAR